ncbi:MAG: pre-peptidase C-terminal domain-containing protein [Gammaproteobacteria bacterium]|nr:pre-peptidase C-terminal domain-containing protein [Gammaproteobacteria bacterium]
MLPINLVSNTRARIRSVAVVLSVLLTWGLMGQEFSVIEIVESESTSQSGNTVRNNESLMVPFFPATTDSFGRQGILRIVNLTEDSGSVNVLAYDDAGRSYGPIELFLRRGQAINLNSFDLEQGGGNTVNGVETGIGTSSTGDWRFEITSKLDINVLSFVQNSEGFLLPIHDIVPMVDGVHKLEFFSAGNNAESESQIRLINPNEQSAEVTIYAMDDEATSGGKVQLSIPPQASITVDAQTLEQGGPGLVGNLGEGTGIWRLDIVTGHSILVMNMLSSRTGFLANLSTRPLQQHEQDDSPDAPTVEVTDQESFEIKWTHTIGADDNLRQAFDVLYRIGTNELWSEACITHNFSETGQKDLTVSIATQDGIPEDSLVQGRYRQRSGPFCVAGRSHSWSSIGEATADSTVDDHGNTVSTATTVAVPSDTVGEIEQSGDLDYFHVNLSERGTLTVETTGPTDTRGRLLNSNENELATDDDDGTGSNFKIEQTVDAGNYYIEVRGYSANTTGSYTLKVSFEAEGSSGASGPDLVWIQSTSDKTTVAPGGVAVFTFVVQNQGDVDSEATTIRFKQSSDSTITTSDSSFSATGSLRALGPDQRFTYEFTVTVGANQSPITVYIGACADTVADESDTTNNCSDGVRLTVSDDDGGGSADSYCRVGDTVDPGQQCDIYNWSGRYFEVSSSGRGCLQLAAVRLCSGNSVSYRSSGLTLVADRNTNNSWTINEVDPVP